MESGLAWPRPGRQQVASGVEPPLADDRARHRHRRTAVERRRHRREAVARQFARRLPDIGPAADAPLQPEVERRHDRGIEAGAEHLHEQASPPVGEARDPRPQQRRVPGGQHRSGGLRRGGDAEFPGQHVGRTERHQPERGGRRFRDAARHLGDRAVAAGGDHHGRAALRGGARDVLGVAGALGLHHLRTHAARRERVERARQPAAAARGRVEDDQHDAGQSGSTDGGVACISPRSRSAAASAAARPGS
jgi:hypothetical protein